jgi:hypothetical protein
MEKRIAGIIRWLERCLEAHRAGEMESALMDVECAQADMDLLRDRVWSKLDRRRAARRRRAFAAAFLKTALGIAVIILATATPLAFLRESGEEISEENSWKETAAAPELAVFDEKEPPGGSFAFADGAKDARRLEASVALAVLTAPAQPKSSPERTAAYAVPKRTEAKARPVAASRQGEKYESGKDDGMNLSYESILALVQTGEKALKNENPAIEIIKRRDRRD